MKVLLTGASGQVGSCYQALAREEYPHLKLLATDRKTLDVTDENSVQQIIADFKPDVIVNAAAYTAVDRAEIDAESAWAVNVKAVENLVSAARRSNVFLIHISTDYVFNGEGDTPFTEEHPCDPQSIYGSTKLAGEHVVQGYKNSVIIRTSWVFSEYGNNFLKTMLRLGKERAILSIVDDQRGCPTYAGDIARTAMQIIFSADHPRGLFHYSGLGEVSWFEFARHILLKANREKMLDIMPELLAITTEQFPTPAKRPKYSVLNTTKITAAGIHPMEWRSGVDKVLQKLKNGTKPL